MVNDSIPGSKGGRVGAVSSPSMGKAWLSAKIILTVVVPVVVRGK